MITRGRSLEHNNMQRMCREKCVALSAHTAENQSSKEQYNKPTEKQLKGNQK